MPTLVNLAFDIADLIGADFDARRTKVWIETNIASGSVIDTTGKVVRLGDVKATVGADGKGTFTGLFATNSADLNPTGFLYQVYVDYATRADGRKLWSSGWFPLTASSDLALVSPVVGGPVNTTDDAVIASRVNDPASQTRGALNAKYVPATVAVGSGIDPTGAADSRAAIQAKIDATPAGGWCLLPEGRYKIASALSITKTMRFGAIGVPRATSDLSHQAGSVQLIYTGTSGDAITVRPPLPDGSGDNGKISVALTGFALLGNKNVSGATGGGGITLDGRSVANCGIDQFQVEDVKISEAKGDGFTVTGDVYEGRVVGLAAFRCGGKGVNVGAASQPGEILWEDIHTNDNAGDGAYLTGAGTHAIGRWSSSRNGGKGFHAKNPQIVALDLQCESNAGSEVVTIEDVVKCAIIGLNVDYTEPSYVGTGLAITGTSQNVVVMSAEFSGTATTWDITTAATTQATVVLGYRASAANKVSFAGTNDLLLSGATVTKGTFEVASDGTTRTPVRVRGFAGQTADLHHWLDSAGNPVARVTAGGSMRGLDDLIARLGATAQAAIGALGPASEPALLLGSAGDTNLYRSAANTLKTDDKLITTVGLGVGNSAAATTPGSVVRKIEVFDAAGVSLGFVPVYGAIT